MNIFAAHAAADIRINCGGNVATDGQGNVWAADAYFVGGTVPAQSANAIDVSAVTNPAPTVAYQTERYGNATYTIPGQTAGAAYTVRLHFAEVYFNAANLRKFNVLINGAQVLTDFDIFATAGAMNKAVAQQFSTTANANGQVVVQFATGSVNNPKICGIEVLPQNTTPVNAGGVAIDSGGAAAGTFVADTYFTGGTVAVGANAITTTGVTNPAPGAVYQSERWGPCTYSIPSLTPSATYKLRLHFAEIYWTAAGQRQFNVAINGATVLTNFDVFASAGGANKAIVKEFNATSNASGQISVQFSVGTADNPKISGIEVVPVSAAAPVISSATTATGQVGTAFSYPIAASNTPTNFNATGLPAGLSVNASTGLISGTPTAAGTSSVTLSASNAAGTGNANLTLTISPPPQVISSATTAAGQPGTAFSYQIAASNTPTSFNATGLPAGLSVNTATGLISGTPTATGVSSVTLKATNAGGTGSATLSLTISNSTSSVAINAGGPVAGTFVADAYFTGGTVAVNTNTISTTGVVSPAPVAVYQSERWGPCTYVITGLNSSTSYVVRLHFAEIWFTGAAGQGAAGVGQRQFNVAINGTTVLSNFDITAAAGAANRAIVEEFNSTSNASGQETIQFSVGAADNPKISGIEIVAGVLPPPPPPAITSVTTATGSVGSYFSYQITATNSPTSFNATGLPAGLSVNPATGLISGTPTAASTSSITLKATNASGTGTATLNLTIGNVALFPAGLTVNPQLLGQNEWYNIPANADPIWTVIGGSGIGMMRIGGAAYDSVPYNNNTLLAYVNMIRAVGAEPLIQVSRQVGNGAAVAAATVQFLNVQNHLNVKYWSIGNEPDLNYNGSDEALCAYVAGYTKPIASAMKAVDPTIKIFATEYAWYTPTKFAPLLGGDQDITGTDANGRYYIDGVSFHRYPFANNLARGDVVNEMHNACPSVVGQLVGQLATANTQHNRTGTSALAWMMGEFNISYNNTQPNGPDNLGSVGFINGQLFAEYFRVGMAYSATTMDTWSINEGGGNGSGGDLGYLGGSLANPTPRSSYYHMQMISDYMLPGGYLNSTSSNGNVGVNATSINGQTQLALMILNEDTANHTFSVRMNTDPVLGTGDTKINVAANHAVEYSGSIPQQSTMILVFDASGNLKRKVTYTITNDEQNQPPTVLNY